MRSNLNTTKRKAYLLFLPLWFWLSGIIIIVDQLSKKWILANFSLYQRQDFTSFFSLTLAYNKGAAFSFLSDASGWQRWFFIVVTLVISIVLLVWLLRLSSSERWLGLALPMILGGALGNLYDRVELGHVVDFILVHYQSWYFPAFNLADSAITVGAFMLIWDMLFSHKAQHINCK